jgi:hypothetical protein
MISVKLVVAVEEFDWDMRELLAKPGRGVPTFFLVNKLGRRHQDNRNLAAQMEAKKKKAAGNSQEQLTVDMVRFNAASTDLSNNQVMRLGKEHRLGASGLQRCQLRSSGRRFSYLRG